MTPRPPWFWWLLIAAAALGLRLALVPLDLIPDECVYIQHAWNVARGGIDLADRSWYVHRIPVYLPTGLLYGLMGLNLASTLVWPLFAAMAQLAMAMLLALRIAGRAASLFAGVLLAFFPLDAVFSVHLMPDVLLGSAMSCAVACWWLAGDADGRRRAAWLVGAGILLAVATLIRPYALILAVFLLLDLWLGRRTPRDLLPAAIGGAAVILVYLASYQIAVGNALYRLDVVADTYASGALAEPAHLLFYPRMLLSPRDLFGLHGIALVMAVPLLLVRPRRDTWRLLAWLAILGLFLEFGSMSFETYLPILKRARFLTPLSLPACVLLGIVLARVTRADALAQGVGPVRAGRILGAVGLAAIVVASITPLRNLVRAERPRYQAYATVASLALERPASPVMLDHWRTALRLGPHVRFFGGRGFYFGDDDERYMAEGAFDPGGRLSYLDPSRPVAELPAGLILIDRRDPYPGKERVLEWLGLCDGCEPTADLEPLYERAGLQLFARSPVSSDERR